MLVRLGLAGARLATDDEALAAALGEGAVRLLGDCIHVRRLHAQALALVWRHHTRRVQPRHRLERVDCHEDGASERVDLSVAVATLDVVQHGCLVQMQQRRVVGRRHAGRVGRKHLASWQRALRALATHTHLVRRALDHVGGLVHGVRTGR